MANLGFGLALLQRRRRSYARWAAGALWILMLAAPQYAQAVPVQLLSGGSTVAAARTPYGFNVGASVFTRARRRIVGEGPSTTAFELTRARLKLQLTYEDWLKLKISPDLERTSYLADAYLEARLVSVLRLRVGQQKVPFGQLEWRSKWQIPEVTRGIVSKQIARRLGFSDRRVGALGGLRLKTLPTKPTLEAGVFANGDVNDRYDGAARIGIKPLKGAELVVAYYRREEAKTDGGAGQAGQLSLEYDRHRVWALAEALVGRARRLTASGVSSGQDATFLGIRGVVGYAFKFDALRLQPFLAGEMLDPGLSTTTDLGYSVRGGVTIQYLDLLRLSLEAEHTDGQSAFILPKSTSLTVFLGMRVG